MTVRWTAEQPGCPSATVMKREIERWVGEGKGPEASMRAVGIVEPQADDTLMLRVTIETVDGSLTAQASAQRCVDLADAFALQVAMAIDPARVGDLASAEELVDTKPDTRKDPSPSATATTVPSNDNAPSRPPALRGAVWVEGGVGAGHVPRFDGRLSAGGSLLLNRARVDLGYVHSFQQRRRHPQAPGAAVDVRNLSGVLRGCWRPQRAPYEFPLCGGAEVGVTSAIGVGVPQPRRTRGLWASATVRAAAQWVPRPWIAVGVVAEGYAAVVRTPVTLDALPPAFTPALLGGWGGLQIEARFP